MELGSLVLSPTLLSLITSVLGVVGLIVWWLIRKRQSRIWLPTVRILNLESRKLPRMILAIPPVVAFLCFLLSALAFSFFAFQPARQMFSAFERDEARYHIFLDLSPSMQASLSIEDYKTAVVSFWDSLNKSGRVSLSSSMGAEVVRPESISVLQKYLDSLRFHRAGLRLGAAVKAQLEEIAAIDRLFVISDSDLHSWNDFNWRVLNADMDIVWVDFGKAQNKLATNYFIDRVDYISLPQATAMEWDVVISRRGEPAAQSGTARVFHSGKELDHSAFDFAKDSVQQTVRMNWPAKLLEESDPLEPLTFQIETTSADAIALDNEFRSVLRGVKQNALIIAEPSGERALEDPTHHLQRSLEVMGFNLRRMDSISQPGPNPKDYPFWIVVAGLSKGIDRYCPKSIESLRLEKQTSQGAKNLFGSDVPVIWFAPEDLSVDYREMCWCYSRLMVSEKPLGSMPSFCQDIASRDNFIGLLNSLGAKQVGGTTADQSGAIAFHSKDEKSGLEMLTFTIPLSPSRVTGITHAGLPLLANSLLNWQGLLGNAGKQVMSDWPRFVDISASKWQGSQSSEQKLWEVSNVPVGESLMAKIDAQQMPPRWLAGGELSAKSLPTRKDQNDPMPWIKICAGLVLLCLMGEAIALAIWNLRRLTRKSSALILMIAFGAMSVSEISKAEIPINLLNYNIPFDGEFSMLSREVARRTSIDLSRKATMFVGFDNAAQRQAWLFVKDLRVITNSNGELTPEAAAWIKRGGFLIIENVWQTETLKKLTTKAFVASEAGITEWQPIPPDHELMRSFHLLDSLPDCQRQVWQGFHFDGRLAILAVPFDFLESLLDQPKKLACREEINNERAVRVFVNILMVVLATDYKKDQIHLPEILKRLR